MTAIDVPVQHDPHIVTALPGPRARAVIAQFRALYPDPKALRGAWSHRVGREEVRAALEAHGIECPPHSLLGGPDWLLALEAAS